MTVPHVVLLGIGVSPGIAFGAVHLLDRRARRHPKHHVDDEAVPHEIERLEHARDEAHATLVSLKEKAHIEHSAILDAHLLMLDDPILVTSTKRKIVDEKKCAEWALLSTVQEIRAQFDALGDNYFRERRNDIDFIGERILDAMAADSTADAIDGVPLDAIVVAHDISPADAIALSRRRVRAFVTEVGGTTGHTAILARALDIPAVLACAGALERAGAGDQVIVDGNAGEVILTPTVELITRYEGVAARRAAATVELAREAALPPVTPDGKRLTLLANIEIPEEVPAAIAYGAEGVGLYRSEFLFLNKNSVPSAEEHEAVCSAILDSLAGRPATLRTFDLGSDKLSSALRVPREMNPALGLRGVRLGLKRPTALRAQLRGMLRAFATRPGGSILIPMVGSVDEVLAVRELLEGERQRLLDEGFEPPRAVKVGAMIELPSAVWIADALADVCDFFSVGTNDLIQYTLAIDRGNEHVAHLYRPLHPAILRALRHVITQAHAKGKPVGLCGEMASEPTLLPIHLGIGFDSLSMPHLALRPVKWLLRRFPAKDATELVDECLKAGRAGDVERLLRDALQRPGLELLHG